MHLSKSHPFIHAVIIKLKCLSPTFLRDVRLLSRSPLFDSKWYLSSYPDVQLASVKPVQHYLLWGASEGRNPSPLFVTSQYLHTYPDVKASQLNPLVHYLRHGINERRLLTFKNASEDASFGLSCLDLQKQTIRAAEVFDDAWYVEQYPDVLLSGLEPLQHFLTVGMKNLRAPSRHFDPSFYLSSYKDVALSGVDPLTHYLDIGRKEGRTGSLLEYNVRLILESGLFAPELFGSTIDADARSKFAAVERYLNAAEIDKTISPGPLFDASEFLQRYPDLRVIGTNPFIWFLKHGERDRRFAKTCFNEPMLDRWGLCGPLSMPALTPGSISIAVVVHVFYLEIFDEICFYLRNIPQPFNLLISTHLVENETQIRNTVSSHHLPATLYIKSSINRGRNFAPFLVEFSELIKQHDLILHLHTKKSLHNGDEAVRWRTHLYRSLIGSPYQINGFLTLFSERHLGVIYPRAYRWLPYWAHHWLSNAHLIDHFFKRIGVAYKTSLTYLDFPVGSMFWASSKALQPLWDADWSYDDFPLESGQLDGTIAHVLERTICLVADTQGYGFIEFDYDSGSLRFDWSRKNLDQYVSRSLASAYADIKASESVSFDIFDTLLTRFVFSPDSLLRYVGWKLQSTSGVNNFFALRKNSEELARRKRDFKGDVDLEQIYQEFPLLCSWTPEQIEYAMSAELEAERRSFVARADVVELLRHSKSLGRMAFAVSDTYFPLSFVHKLLDHHGLLDLFARVYISSATGWRKDRGDMWDALLQEQKLIRPRHIHFGDNEHSDAQLAGDRRLGVFHLMSPRTLMAHAGVGLEKPKSWQMDLLFGPVAANIFNSPFLKGQAFRPVVIASAQDFGHSIFGPLLFTFFSWLLRHPSLNHIDKLFFLSREGYFLHSLYKKISFALPRSMPKSSYLYVSRRAALAAAQAVSFRPEDVIFGSGFKGSIKTLVKARLGVELPRQFDLDQTIIELPKDGEYVCTILSHLSEYIQTAARSESDMFKEYCRQERITPESGLVDVGYSASIQNATQTVLGHGLTGFYVATTPAAERVQSEGGFAFGCYAERESFARTNSSVLRNCRILETFLTAPNGQVLRFERGATSIRPVFKQQGLSQTFFSDLRDIYSGVENYFEQMFQAYGPECIFCDYDLDDAQILFKSLVDHKIQISEKLAAALFLEDEFCGNQELPAGSLAVAT